MADKLTILLTGATGQVGFDLWRCLSLKPYRLVLGLRQPEGASYQGYPCVPFDLADNDQLRRSLEEVKPNLVIHPAAYTQVDRAEDEPDRAYQINAGCLEPIVDYLRQTEGGLIHFSTDYIYHPNHTDPLHENDSKNPKSVYGKTKLAGEQLIEASSVAHWIWRTSWVYGIKGPNFVKTMLRLGQTKDALRIVDDQIGVPTSSLTLALATAQLLAATESPVARIKDTSGAYHLTDEGEISWYQFAQEIFRQARELGMSLTVGEVSPIPTAEYPTPAPRPLNSRLSLAKVERTFGLAVPGWRQALGYYLASLKEA
jgi:dTDP-4-dehydrorhamnose reductase